MYKQNNPTSQPLQAMIFDLDGTLFQTETIIIPAYHAMFDQLRTEGLYQGETPPDSRILGSLGMLLDDIFERVMPEASVEAKRRANALFLQYEIVELQERQGSLYPHVASTLQKLHTQGIRLFIASNGLKDYVEQVIQTFGLTSLFEGLYSAGEYQTKSKVDLVRILLTRHQINFAWMVGDRSSDVEAGLQNQLTVVGCQYAGFAKEGELEGSTYIINQFDQLLELVQTSQMSK